MHFILQSVCVCVLARSLQLLNKCIKVKRTTFPSKMQWSESIRQHDMIKCMKTVSELFCKCNQLHSTTGLFICLVPTVLVLALWEVLWRTQNTTVILYSTEVQSYRVTDFLQFQNEKNNINLSSHHLLKLEPCTYRGSLTCVTNDSPTKSLRRHILFAGKWSGIC